MDQAARRQWWEAKISLKAVPEARGFFTLAGPLSPPDTYRRIDGDLPASVIGAGRERAVMAPVEPGDTFHLQFHGVGEQGQAAVARLWALEPRGHGYDGRHLADLTLRLGGDEHQSGGPCRRSPSRWVTSIDVPVDMAPFPGIIAHWNNHFCNMTDLVMGVWDYTAYILEATLAVPDGAAPMQACAALWRAFPHPKPLTDAQLRQRHEEFNEWLRDSGVEFNSPDDEGEVGPHPPPPPGAP